MKTITVKLTIDQWQQRDIHKLMSLLSVLIPTKHKHLKVAVRQLKDITEQIADQEWTQ